MTSEVLDDFEGTSGWVAVASGLAQLTLSPERAPNHPMCLGFDFKGRFNLVSKVLHTEVTEII